MTRILLADPDPRSQQHIASLLEERGYTLDAAPDLAAALAPVQEGAVDLILADLSLPGGGGMELLLSLRIQLTHLGAQVVGRQLLSNYAKPAKDESIQDLLRRLMQMQPLELGA